MHAELSKKPLPRSLVEEKSPRPSPFNKRPSTRKILGSSSGIPRESFFPVRGDNARGIFLFSPMAELGEKVVSRSLKIYRVPRAPRRLFRAGYRRTDSEERGPAVISCEIRLCEGCDIMRGRRGVSGAAHGRAGSLGILRGQE